MNLDFSPAALKQTEIHHRSGQLGKGGESKSSPCLELCVLGPKVAVELSQHSEDTGLLLSESSPSSVKPKHAPDQSCGHADGGEAAPDDQRGSVLG